ncbi:hypothetical protein IU450_26605 [Nocardia abscessus]|nr:hypothetical protein [Nocardia abscessus]MBF6339438.1 hypothetical protein [Nocardia abscessus]
MSTAEPTVPMRWNGSSVVPWGVIAPPSMRRPAVSHLPARQVGGIAGRR